VVILGAGLLYKKKLEKIIWVDFFKIMGVGLILAFHWVTFYGSVKYANASVAVVCLSAAGFFSALIEPLLLRKRLVWVELLLGLLAMVGIYIIFDFNPQFKIGIIFGMISSLGSATFPILNKRLLVRFSPKILTFYELSGGLLLLTLLLPFYFIKFVPTYYIPSMSDMVWLLILAAICTVFAYDLQLQALTKISAFTSNLTYNLEPLYGIILAFLLFKEHQLLNGYFYFGLIFIVLAIVLQMLRVFYFAKVSKI
jgi:drug/metabolite transporter (DMT)-like permease